MDFRWLQACDLLFLGFAGLNLLPNVFCQVARAGWPVVIASGSCAEWFGQVWLGGSWLVGAVVAEQRPYDVDAAAR
jgi:hypothetical protein